MKFHNGFKLSKIGITGRSSLIILLALWQLMSARLLGQQQSPPSKPLPSENEAVVQLSTTLIQLDAVVTDNHGHIVSNLKPEDFEVYEDGKLQKISNFSFVSLSPTSPAQPTNAVATNAKPDKYAPPLPTKALSPDQIKRSIALVVDDLNMAAGDLAFVRKSLRTFVAEQMQPGDLMSISRTSASSGGFQHYTTSKDELFSIIDGLRYYLDSIAGIDLSTTASVAGRPQPSSGVSLTLSDVSAARFQPPPIAGAVDQMRADAFAAGAVGALDFLVRGLREMPGRKSIIFLSDGFHIKSNDGSYGRTSDALARVIDSANRAGVVIYTIDTGGLQVLNFTAMDNNSVNTRSGGKAMRQMLNTRRSAAFDNQDPLALLASQTGGIFLHNFNDISYMAKQAYEDQSGYYLIGYQPADDTFELTKGQRKYHRWKVKVKHPGFTVRFRHGFLGIEIKTDDLNAAYRASQSVGSFRSTNRRSTLLLHALYSPLENGNLHLRLTSLFGSNEAGSSVMRSLLHIDGRDLTFKDVIVKNEKDGTQGIWHETVIDVLAVTYGYDGNVVDQVTQSFTIRIPTKSFQTMLDNGVTYNFDVPIRKPGAYQLRTSVVDAGSDRVGSASQFIAVPDLSKNKLALSGIGVKGVINKRVFHPADAQNATANSEIVAEADPAAGPAVRKFHINEELNYAYEIYNAQLSPTTQKPDLITQLRLFRDGQLIFSGELLPINANQPDLKRLTVTGKLTLGSVLQPGQYVLQVLVTDQLLKDKNKVAAQWIDFELNK